jgi:hypothetical protein
MLLKVRYRTLNIFIPIFAKHIIAGMIVYFLAPILLLLSGDVETKPGPPRSGPSRGRTKETSNEDQMNTLQEKVY